jgi:hypothetical protein
MREQKLDQEKLQNSSCENAVCIESSWAEGFRGNPTN